MAIDILLTDPCTRFDSSRRTDAFSVDANPLATPWVAMQQMYALSSLNGRLRTTRQDGMYVGMLHTGAGILGDQSVQAVGWQYGWDAFGPILRGRTNGSGYLCFFGRMGYGDDDYYYGYRVSAEVDAGTWKYASNSDLFVGDWGDNYGAAMNPLQYFWTSDIGVYDNLKTVQQQDPPTNRRTFPLCQSIASGEQGVGLFTLMGTRIDILTTVLIQTRGAGDIGVLARTDLNGNGYLLIAHQEGASPSGSDWVRLYRVTDNGATRTQIGPTSTARIAAEDDFRLWCSGTTLVACLRPSGGGESELFRVTDGTYASGYSGLLISDTTTQGDNKVWQFQHGLPLENLDPAEEWVTFAPFQPGDVMRCEVVGFTIRAYVNGVLVCEDVDTRAAFASGYPGWTLTEQSYGDGDWVENLFDNWEAQEL